jgi:hypothetical protein
MEIRPKKFTFASGRGFLTAYGLQSTPPGPHLLTSPQGVNKSGHNTNKSQPNSGRDNIRHGVDAGGPDTSGPYI